MFWKDHGTNSLVAVVCLDLFTCGSQSLLPLLPLLKELFAIRNNNVPNAPEPVLTWSHKKRGYRDYFGADGQLRNSTNHQEEDDDDDSKHSTELELERFLLGSTGVDSQAKTPQLETSTKFQQVEIYGTASSNKRLFLDGVLQSTLNGLEAYHEALVHPALTMVEGAASDSSSCSLRVAIIGGGEGTTLREVLKHKSVESCTMIDIDAEFMDLARVHLPEWNDCRDLVDAAPANNNKTDGYSSCFDHPRARVFPEDAILWFIGRYHKEQDIDESEKFDVIIMDAL